MVDEFSDDEILDLIIKLDSIWKSPKRNDAMTKIAAVNSDISAVRAKKNVC